MEACESIAECFYNDSSETAEVWRSSARLGSGLETFEAQGFPGVAASQTFTVPSTLPLASRLRSGLKATLWTKLVCALRVRVSWPVAGSRTFMVPSPPPVASRFPSGLQAALQTWLEGEVFWPVAASHTFTVLPKLPLANPFRRG